MAGSDAAIAIPWPIRRLPSRCALRLQLLAATYQRDSKGLMMAVRASMEKMIEG